MELTMKFCRSSFRFMSGTRAQGLALAVSILVLAPRLYAAGEQRFATPEDAVSALTAATATKDTNAMHAIFGPAAHDLVSPDVVQATATFEKFAQNLTEKVTIIRESDSKATLQLGADRWPFPIPLVKQDEQWFFDTEAGREEILNRRIGRNEIGVIHVCHAYVDAQREYASEDRNGDGILEYAQLLRSTPGKHDGLYWPMQPGEEISPLGPLIAQAHGEGYRGENKIMTDEQTPFHGYYFKILTQQGKHAPVGKYNYIINGHMIAGFAFVAWPAEWGNSGVMTFVVNQQGKVYQKNLGSKTSSLAQVMTTYDPDDTWILVQDN
jgi:hypothetical protein